MNRQFWLYVYFRRRKLAGFTLIELLVVVIIIGILSAIAAPVLLKQVEKGRQAEARTTLGAINRSQQAYRLENATFTVIGNLPTQLPNGKYYTFDDDTTGYALPDPIGSAQRALANAAYNNDIRNYASAVGQTVGGVYEAIICEAREPTDDTVTTNNVSGDVDCVNGNPLK
jgi:type IV pilus assembly protein PilA